MFLNRYAQVFVKNCSYFLKMNVIRSSLVCFCQEIFKKVCVWLYIEKNMIKHVKHCGQSNQQCDELSIYKKNFNSNKKKRNYNILLNYMFFISLYLTLPSYISSSRVCSSRINILFLFLGVGGSPFFSLLFFFSCLFDYW